MDVRDLAPWARGRGLSRRDMPDPFTAFQREMNRLFEDAFGAFNLPGPMAGLGGAMTGGAMMGTAWPSVSVAETDKAYVVRAEVPGMDPKDVELAVTEDMLVLRGEKRSVAEDARAHVSEHFYGRFERRMSLSSDIDRDNISAAFDKGVLSITLPKRADAGAAAKRIPIAQGEQPQQPQSQG